MTSKTISISLLKRNQRQVKRIWARYRLQGDAGLLHGNQGRPFNRLTISAVREAALEAYRLHYPDFGPTLAEEKLCERQGIQVDHETLHRWFLACGQWKRQRRRSE